MNDAEIRALDLPQLRAERELILELLEDRYASGHERRFWREELHRIEGRLEILGRYDEVNMNSLSFDKRREILEREVAAYSRRGYRVIAQTDTTAQLVKPKQFSFLWATVWFLMFGIGLLVYLFYYWSKQEEIVYLVVDERGHVKRR